MLDFHILATYDNYKHRFLRRFIARVIYQRWDFSEPQGAAAAVIGKFANFGFRLIELG